MSSIRLTTAGSSDREKSVLGFDSAHRSRDMHAAIVIATRDSAETIEPQRRRSDGPDASTAINLDARVKLRRIRISAGACDR